MSAFGEAAETEPPTADPVTVRLDEILDELEAVVADNTPVRDAARIDRIARLEKLRAATADFRSPNRCGSPSPRLPSSSPLMFIRLPSGRGIAEQIGLACRISPVTAARRLNTARSLWFELPDTYRQLIAGELSQRLAETVVSETRHLDPGQRCQVDAQLAARAISEMGFKTAVACIRKAAYQADRQGYLQRGRTERHHRRVGVRPAPDTMAMLTGYLPLEQGIACYAALRHQADTAVATGDGRTRDQIMADTHSLSRSRIAHESAAVVVSRRGKSASARSSSVRRCAIPDARGSGGTDYRASTSHRCQCGAAAADATGFLAQHGECECRSHPRLRAAARQARPTNPRQQSGAQMVAAPVHRAQRVTRDSGPIIGGDPTRRYFDGWLAKLIKLRDQTCRDPFCDAPIRHIDHIKRHTDGGLTTFTNGRGACERGNQVREMPGWHITLIDCGFHAGPHKIIITTPTGHNYLSRAPDPP